MAATNTAAVISILVSATYTLDHHKTLGIYYLFFSARDLLTGRLVRPFELPLPVSYAYWIVCPRANANLPKITTFRDWLLGEAAEETRSRAQSLEQRFLEIEELFIDVNLTGAIEDSFRNSMKLYGRYIELMRELDGTADFPPTVQQQEVADLLRDRLLEALSGLNELLETELDQFNSFLTQQNIGVTIR